MDIAAALSVNGLTWPTFALILTLALAAGWVDAVVGGGGLLQLPAVLLVPGIHPVQALATNKLGSIFGTATAGVTYFRRVHPDLRTVAPMAVTAVIGSMSGAAVATLLPVTVFKPVIVIALIVVVVITALRPQLGRSTSLRYSGLTHYLVAALIGLGIGFYDGLLGPGTGTFLVLALVGLLGYDFLQASAKAKLVNFATNLGALISFIPHGAVLWRLGLTLAAANMIGGYLGSRTAVARGTTFIRVVFLIVACVLIGKLGVDVWTENQLGRFLP